jgi:putative ligand-binding protein with streptavidin-like fold
MRDTTVLGKAALLALAMAGAPNATVGIARRSPSTVAASALVGLWRSADGGVRLTIKTDGTYAGEVTGRKRPAQGTYRVEGSTMTLDDDTGLRTPVILFDGELEMAGHRLGRV